MAASLVSGVMQFLTPDLIAKIASGLGLDRSVAQKALEAPSRCSFEPRRRGFHPEWGAPTHQRSGAATTGLAR